MIVMRCVEPMPSIDLKHKVIVKWSILGIAHDSRHLKSTVISVRKSETNSSEWIFFPMAQRTTDSICRVI